ncbi:MAG: tRNA 2-thiouridine(34) synthase MnmA [Patescibacteria group bacterium]|nr:tRNA 2-thiouridine(34) synthase MnmA [Patescibacteria group bacterium]
MKKGNKKVILGLSGGIDSSVAAALLKGAGFDVVGIFMRLYDSPNFKQSEKRAKKIASILDIDFLSLDLRKEFDKKIIQPFIKEHKQGRTPNPCIICNKEIKFNVLFKKMKELKADFIATGHYARIRNKRLLRAKDKSKDQSYFLWQLNSKLLNKTLFPLGGYTKKEILELSKDFNLPLEEISDSQEICFVQSNLINFLKDYLKQNSGKILDSNNNVIGEHKGLWSYTIGQRKGIGFSGGPYYVVKKDINKNTLIVSKNEKELYKKELIAKDVNWVMKNKPKFPLKVKAMIRYRSNLCSAVVNMYKGNKIKVVFVKSQRAITSGQSIVFYNGQELLGGGIIDNY